MKIKSTITAALLAASSFLLAQTEQGLLLSLQQLPDQSWGVFMKPGEALSPSHKTVMGTGQVTLVTPSRFEYSNFKNHAGSWVENARVNNPIEAFGKSYVSFGFVTDLPKSHIAAGEETLLFSFTADEKFSGQLYLIDNNSDDPFLPPNSLSTNPGNELSMVDIGDRKNIKKYFYAGNYIPENQAKPVFANKGDKTENAKNKLGKNGKEERVVLNSLEEEQD
ncbi:MAG TPA: hypothetical protein ENJ95_23455 [Bacteroidetes bacterium]|nr:hypothetical protein [Bacteroidota bacterium]